MLEGPLRFAIVVEAEFVDRTIADRPGVRDVPLLKALRDLAAESRNVGASQLKVGKRLSSAVVGEIVVSAEALAGVDLVIKLESCLVTARRLHRNGLNQIRAGIRQ